MGANRGATVDDMFKKHHESSSATVFATGKNYCKPMKNLICIRGMNGIVVGGKREANHLAEDSDDEEMLEEEARIKRLRQEKEDEIKRHQQEIEARYCGAKPEEQNMPDRMRLG